MMIFTEEQYEALQAQAREIFDNIAEGQGTREIIARIYADNLDDKTIKQGEFMADSILEAVKKFDADYEEAQEDVERFVGNFQDEIDAEKSCVERCNYWLQMSAAISAATIAMSEDGADREQILQDIESMVITEEEATPEREKELREQAKDAMINSGVMLGALLEQADALEEMASAEEAAGLLIDLGNDAIEYRAIVAMLAYTKIKNGELDNIPVEMPAEQVATMVCAAIEQNRIMEAVGKGKLAVNVAAGLLGLVGLVVVIQAGVLAGAMGVALIPCVFGPIMAIPAFLMLLIGIYHAMGKAIDAWFDESKKIVTKITATIGDIMQGVKAVARFVNDNVISKIITKAKETYNNIKNRQEEFAEDTNTIPVTEN